MPQVDRACEPFAQENGRFKKIEDAREAGAKLVNAAAFLGSKPQESTPKLAPYIMCNSEERQRELWPVNRVIRSPQVRFATVPFQMRDELGTFHRKPSALTTIPQV